MEQKTIPVMDVDLGLDPGGQQLPIFVPRKIQRQPAVGGREEAATAIR